MSFLFLLHVLFLFFLISYEYLLLDFFLFCFSVSLKFSFPQVFTKTLYTFLDYSICTTCPVHLSLLDLRFLIMLGEEYSACGLALCNFLHSPAVSSLLASNIFISTLFQNSLNLCSFLKVRNQVSQPYNTSGNIMDVYVLTFNYSRTSIIRHNEGEGGNG